MTSRRQWIGMVLGGAAAAVVGRGGVALAEGAAPALTVWKSPTCGCCAKWVQHMKDHGFAVQAHDVEDIDAVKTKHGVPDGLSSCHTGLVGGYVLEGHVPAAAVQKLLRERPKVVGIAVPGMPVGSPGMEAGDVKQPFDVVAWTRDGKRSTFAKG